MPALLTAVVVLSAAISGCKQNKFCPPKSPCGRASCRNTHMFKWDHPKLLFFPALTNFSSFLLHSEIRRKQQIHEKIFLNNIKASVHLLADCKNLTLLFFYFTLHCWFSRLACCISETASGSLCLWFPAPCAETALKANLCFSCFVHHKQQQRLDFQNIWQFQLVTHEAEESGELCVHWWWLCSASGGAGCAGTWFLRGKGV